jgi:ribonucleoside-triphosphate reductase
VYPDIITQGEGDGVFYTNSSHIYVGDDISLGYSLNIQQKFKSYYNGGTLFHIFCGESSPDRDGLKDLIRNICTNTTIPYLALTRAYAVCPGCGVSSDLSGICPDCGAETTVWDRVTGYYRPQEKYNPGKQAEFLARKRFEVG